MQREAARTASAGRLHSLCTRLATIFKSRLAISVQVRCSTFFCASFPISAVPREHPARPSQTSVTAVFLVALIQASDLGLPQHLQQLPCPPASTPDRSIRCFTPGLCRWPCRALSEIDTAPSKLLLRPSRTRMPQTLRASDIIGIRMTLYMRTLLCASLKCSC